MKYIKANYGRILKRAWRNSVSIRRRSLPWLWWDETVWSAILKAFLTMHTQRAGQDQRDNKRGTERDWIQNIKCVCVLWHTIFLSQVIETFIRLNEGYHVKCSEFEMPRHPSPCQRFFSWWFDATHVGCLPEKGCVFVVGRVRGKLPPSSLCSFSVDATSVLQWTDSHNHCVEGHRGASVREIPTHK